MSYETWMHDGTAWRNGRRIYMRDNFNWRRAAQIWGHDGTAWRLIFKDMWEKIDSTYVVTNLTYLAPYIYGIVSNPPNGNNLAYWDGSAWVIVSTQALNSGITAGGGLVYVNSIAAGGLVSWNGAAYSGLIAPTANQIQYNAGSVYRTQGSDLAILTSPTWTVVGVGGGTLAFGSDGSTLYGTLASGANAGQLHSWNGASWTLLGGASISAAAKIAYHQSLLFARNNSGILSSWNGSAWVESGGLTNIDYLESDGTFLYGIDFGAGGNLHKWVGKLP